MALGAAELGRLIAKARDEANLSQAELAEKIGLKHPQSISRYERGETEVPAKRLRRIAEVTRKPLSYFLGADPEAELGGEGGWENVVLRLEALEQSEGQTQELLRELVELLRDGAVPHRVERSRDRSV